MRVKVSPVKESRETLPGHSEINHQAEAGNRAELELSSGSMATPLTGRTPG